MSKKQLRITLVRSPIGYDKTQKGTVRALGLHQMHGSVTHDDTLPIRGMINKISHLVKVEEIDG
ncbi:MAG: 50S ribosomal protein L30 [Anaerolineae bacterium]|nr:50S ribosomal protein L30 [Anaerolineae bacterium]